MPTRLPRSSLVVSPLLLALAPAATDVSFGPADGSQVKRDYTIEMEKDGSRHWWSINELSASVLAQGTIPCPFNDKSEMRKRKNRGFPRQSHIIISNRSAGTQKVFLRPGREAAISLKRKGGALGWYAYKKKLFAVDVTRSKQPMAIGMSFKGPGKAYIHRMVIRGYLTGHAWREYKAGQRLLSGVPMPEGLKEHDRFPSPIITPATKAEEGHDEDISREDIIGMGLVSEEDYVQMEEYTYKLFERGTIMAAEKGLILVDTKYEFGKREGKIYLIDEIHTPDSSRYFYADGYEERQARGAGQKQLSKEFVREWLMAHEFQGLEGQVVPEMPDEFVHEITDRYIELYEKVFGRQPGVIPPEAPFSSQIQY